MQENKKQNRSKIFLVSKTIERAYDGYNRDLETSLKNLQTDHLDLYHIHGLEKKNDTDLMAIEKGAVRAARAAVDQK
ncbi:MAG: aldo/keto reductase, partial [Methanothrix sp.]|nr:aldo/keto reductase [Methanothrix sp.]